MAIIRIVCLANSYKEGGRCLAGMELDSNNCITPKMQWIRPVCQTTHNEIPSAIVQAFHPLDIIEFNQTKQIGVGFQSENVLFDDNSITKLGTLDFEVLETIAQKSPKHLFGNTLNTLSATEAALQQNSLTLIKVTNFSIFEQKDTDRPYPKIKLRFKYHNAIYELAISDPIVIQHCKRNKNLLATATCLYLTISLGACREGFHNKIIAAILYQE